MPREKLIGGGSFDPSGKGTSCWGAHALGVAMLWHTRRGVWVQRVHVLDPVTLEHAKDEYHRVSEGEAALWFVEHGIELPPGLEHALAGDAASRRPRTAADGELREPTAVRLSPRERADLRARAAERGVTLSEYIRAKALEGDR